VRCSSCNTDNPEGKRFCRECGGALKARCPHCGAETEPLGKFCGDCGATLSVAPAPRPPSSGLRVETPEPALRIRLEATTGEIPEGERKTVTLLFADIKGSTDLMEDLDPEEARAIVDPALKLMIDASHHYDGYIVQSTGDGIFALFGAPIAHEDHPQRALYAALRMQEQLRGYSSKLVADGGTPLEARVGVNTGEVVVRSIATGAGHLEYTPIGHSTSLAARMQAVAPTGSVAVTDATRKLCEGYFVFKSLGPTRIKGVSDLVEVHEVIGIGTLRTRLEVSAHRGLSKFVGRQTEIEAMKRGLESARGGHGQIVAAVGEAGVGKSRLFHEFKAVASRGCLTLETFSLSHGKASASLPLIELLKNYFEIVPTDDERKRREKVTGRVIALDRSLEDILPQLFALLGISEPGAAPIPIGVDPQVLRRRTFEALKRLLLRESLNQPVLVIFEDLHWVDSETQAFLDLMADATASARLLLLVNYRPEYRHDWGGRSYYTQLRLDPLGKESADEMLGALFGETLPSPGSAAPRRPFGFAQGKPHLPGQGEVHHGSLSDLKRFIVEKTQGNPFFMEEMVRALFDQGVLVRNGAVKAAKPVSEIKIPATVQGILASRIDRLAPQDKELLQTLAVIGPEFPQSLVKRVASLPDDQLQRSLTNLQLAEFIYEQPAVGEIEYTFKHALTLEVAYNSILTERRKAIHERIALAIEKQFADRLGDYYGELARHLSRSGNVKKAIHYLSSAAFQAAQHSSYSEVIAYVTSALELLSGLPESERRNRGELYLRLTLGMSLAATKGFDSDELEQAYTRARDLARELNEPSVRAVVLGGLWGFHFTRGHVERTLKLAKELMANALQLNDPGLISDAHRAMGSALDYTGDLLAARDHLEQGIAIAADVPKPIGRLRYEPDSNVLLRTVLSGVLFELGYPDQALKRAYEAMAAVDSKSDPFSSAMAMVAAVQAHCSRREPARGEELARAALALSEEHAYPFWLSMSRRMLAWALGLQGHVQESIELMEQDRHSFSGPQADMVHYRVLLSLADGYETIGESQRASALLDQWFALRGRLGLNANDAFYYRLRARRALRAGVDQEAVKNLRESLAAAAERKSMSGQLRAAMELGRLLKKQGRIEEARTTLAKIYNWFTEGFDIADLKDAKALLAELGE
jgi:class 3 adenylate cyclase/tetratricopeptide (TPR) repeat protein